MDCNLIHGWAHSKATACPGKLLPCAAIFPKSKGQLPVPKRQGVDAPLLRTMKVADPLGEELMHLRLPRANQDVIHASVAKRERERVRERKKIEKIEKMEKILQSSPISQRNGDPDGDGELTHEYWTTPDHNTEFSYSRCPSCGLSAFRFPTHYFCLSPHCSPNVKASQSWLQQSL